MYVGAWQEFHAHKRRVKPRASEADAAEAAPRGVSKSAIKAALMGSEIDPKDVERVMQAMKPLLEKSPEEVRGRKPPLGGGKDDQHTGRVVDWNAPSSREKGLRYEGHMKHKTPLVIGAFHDGRGNAKGLPPLVLDQGQFDAQKYAMSQWYGHPQQGGHAGHHGSLPTSARSNGTNASNFTSVSEGVAPRGKGGGGGGGVNTDGGRVSPILSVVADVDAMGRSEAIPPPFHVDVLQRYTRGGPGGGPIKPRAPYLPRQPPYDAQQAVNLLRMERNTRPGGALRGYWKWGDKPGGVRGGGEGASVVRPTPTRVETEAERIAAVRRMQTMYLENAMAPKPDISAAVDMSLYKGPGMGVSVDTGDGAHGTKNWRPQHHGHRSASMMTDSPVATPKSRMPSAPDCSGFVAPFIGLKPNTPNIRDINLSDDDLMLVSKYFNEGQAQHAHPIQGRGPDHASADPPHSPASMPSSSLVLPLDGIHASIDTDTGMDVGMGIRMGSVGSLGSMNSDDVPGTAGTENGEHGLLQWTNTLDLDSI